MKVLGVLQNIWVRDPDRLRAMLARSARPEDLRRRFLAMALFAGCLTGRRLRQALGEQWCERIIWEEASREIGGEASSLFPPDLVHLATLLERERPDVVIAFGAIAREGLLLLVPHVKARFLIAPHPAARGPETLPALRAIRDTLDLFQTLSDPELAAD